MEHWHIEGTAPDDGATVIANRESGALARTCADDWTKAGYTNIRIRWSPSNDVEVTFDPSAPTVLDALHFALEGSHSTGPDLARILGVSLAELHTRFDALAEADLLEVMDRDRGIETWIAKPPMNSLDEVISSAKRKAIALDVPLRS